MKIRHFEVVPLAEAIGKRYNDVSPKKRGDSLEKEEKERGAQRCSGLEMETRPTTHEPQAKRILVVDDEDCISESLTMILRGVGYDATARNNPRSALQECELRVPDLLISDVMMPEINGIDLAIQIEQKYPSCGILLISGMGSSIPLLEEASRKGHSFEILAKPIRPADLLARIAALLADNKAQLITGTAVGTGNFLKSTSRSGI